MVLPPRDDHEASRAHEWLALAVWHAGGHVTIPSRDVAYLPPITLRRLDDTPGSDTVTLIASHAEGHQPPGRQDTPMDDYVLPEAIQTGQDRITAVLTYATVAPITLALALLAAAPIAGIAWRLFAWAAGLN